MSIRGLFAFSVSVIMGMAVSSTSTALFAEHRICIYGHSVLHKVAEPVEVFDDTLKAMIGGMLDTLHVTGNGVGLAAPQVGLSKRIVVIDYPCPKELTAKGKESEKIAWETKMTPSFADEAVLDDREIVRTVGSNLEGTEKTPEKKPAVSGNIFDIFPLVLINPKVSFLSDEQEDSREGCLSLPGIMGVVKRRRELVVEYQDKNGKSHRLKCRGFLTKIVQHETDHLNGMLYVDYKLVGNNLCVLWDPIWELKPDLYECLRKFKDETITQSKLPALRKELEMRLVTKEAALRSSGVSEDEINIRQREDREKMDREIEGTFWVSVENKEAVLDIIRKIDSENHSFDYDTFLQMQETTSKAQSEAR